MSARGLLNGQRIFVAGGTGNVGRLLTGALLRAGARVAVSSRSEERLIRLREAVGADTEQLVTIVGDISDDADGARIRSIALGKLRGLDTVFASLGTFIGVRSLLATSTAELRRALDDFVVAHHAVLRNLLPALMEHGGAYVFLNGMLAFEPMPGGTLVSTATAGQAMLARVVMDELRDSNVRANEVVLYSSFGRPDDDALNRNGVSKSDVIDFLVRLASPAAHELRSRSIHLKSRESIADLIPDARVASE